MLINYSEKQAVRLKLDTPEDCKPYLAKESVSWIDVRGLGNEDLLQRLGQVFQIHPLVLEDIMSLFQRPKFENYKDQQLMTCRMVLAEAEGEGFYNEQFSIILGRNYVLTIQEESEYDCLDALRDRIRCNKGTAPCQGPDYLTYCLIDAIIDGYFPVLEDYGEPLEKLESEVIRSPSPQTLEKLYQVKRELLMLRRSIWPQRDAINMLIREALIQDEVRVYLRDCYDHAVQVIDMAETYRELACSMTEVYLSSVSNHMNEVNNRLNENIRFLTDFLSIFMPLTFIVGIYGMNFEFMPELQWSWGYPFVWLVMLSVAGSCFTSGARAGFRTDRAIGNSTVSTV